MSAGYKDERGSMMLTALLMLLALSVTVFMAFRVAVTNSKLMRNNMHYRDNLYRAESVLSVAVEEHKEQWLDSGSDLLDLENKSARVKKIKAEIKNSEEEIIQVGKYSASRIESNPASGDLSAEFYPLHHKAPPEAGSGTSGKKTARRYGVYATGTNRDGNGKVVIEAGFIKIF